MSGAWDASLFDCMSDMKICCVTMFCGTCQIAYQKAKVEGHEPGFMDFLLVICFPFCCAVKVRSDIREKYSINGGFLGDCCTLMWCGLCGIVQQHRQLIAKGDKPAGCCMN